MKLRAGLVTRKDGRRRMVRLRYAVRRFNGCRHLSRILSACSSTLPQHGRYSMKYTIPLVFLSLAGCGTGVVPPFAVEIRMVTKTVEVQRPCPVTQPARPARLAKPLPTDAVKLAATLGAALAAYTAPGAWADRMEAALGQCAKP